MHKKAMILALAFALILLAFSPAVAARNAALAVTSVDPALVYNHISTVLTIHGSDFVSGATVFLDGSTPLVTSFKAGDLLNAILPAGVAIGQHRLSVANPDGNLAEWSGSLDVRAPQQEEPTPTATPTATLPPTATNTPTATPTEAPSGSGRPVVVISAYSTDPGLVKAGQDFRFDLRLVNMGQVTAHNLIVTLVSGDFVPRKTGGVLAVDSLAPDEKVRLRQPLTASRELQGGVVTTEVKISYTDPDGVLYSESFVIAVNTTGGSSGSGVLPTATPTPTATPVAKAQLVISSYTTDLEVLQPGTRFNLALQVTNNGALPARRVTMVVGGATINTGSGNGDGSGDTGGSINASGGEFTHFSPLGVSNVQTIGDLEVGASVTAEQPLIVNVSTNPGAYSFKISFVYNDASGKTQIDDQVISLLVFSPPVVEVNFYRDPGPLFAGQPNVLPIQVVNLGRNSTVLGNMRVLIPDGFVENSTILVGTLEAGGYFTLDSMLTPNQPGPLEILVTIDYTDDFNQAQTITRVIPVDILEAPIMEGPGMGPGEGEGFPPPEFQPESFWQKLGRFLAGLFGLNSARAEPGMEAPPVEPGMEEFPPVQPIPSGGKG